MDQTSPRHPPTARPRHDGWTDPKKVGFIVALHRFRSVTRAAASVGMSRESAYRLRARASSAEFAAAWDHALRRAAESHAKRHEGHASPNAAGHIHPRKGDEGHGFGGLARHGQASQAPRISDDRRAALLAAIERAGRG